MPTRQTRRLIVALVSILAWIWLISAFFSAIPELFGSSPVGGLFTIAGGFFTYFATQGTARMIGRWLGLGRENAGRITFKTLRDNWPGRPIDETPVRLSAPLRGVGGWLLFFIIFITIVSPVETLAFTAIDINSTATLYPELPRLAQWSAYVSIYWMIAVFASVVLCFAGYLLWSNRKADSVTFAKIVLWICWPLSSLAVLEITYFIFNLPMARVLSLESAKMATFNVLAATACTYYLSASARVKNTYDHDPLLSGKELSEPTP
jgi:hypothetical protein